MTRVNNDSQTDNSSFSELRPHPNVVQMLGVSSDGPYPVMILEFCDGGSLDDKVFNMNEPITSQQQLEIVIGIAKGLYHLHKNQIVHRDLAARNILVSSDSLIDTKICTNATYS